MCLTSGFAIQLLCYVLQSSQVFENTVTKTAVIKTSNEMEDGEEAKLTKQQRIIFCSQPGQTELHFSPLEFLNLLLIHLLLGPFSCTHKQALLHLSDKNTCTGMQALLDLSDKNTRTGMQALLHLSDKNTCTGMETLLHLPDKNTCTSMQTLLHLPDKNTCTGMETLLHLSYKNTCTGMQT